MKINVLKMDDGHQPPFVWFECRVGMGGGQWIDTKQPILGDFYSVEFDIAKRLTASDIDVLTKPHYSLSLNKNTMTFSGKVEDMDSDGMSYFRLSTDCLIMLEAEPNTFLKNQHIVFSLPLEVVKIYPHT